MSGTKWYSALPSSLEASLLSKESASDATACSMEEGLALVEVVTMIAAVVVLDVVVVGW